MNDWTTKDYVAAIIATIVTFLILRAIFRWIWRKISGGSTTTTTPAGATTTTNTNWTFATDWLAFGKSVAVIICAATGIGLLAYILLRVFNPSADWYAKAVENTPPKLPTPTFTMTYDYTEPKFWFIVAGSLIGIIIIFKVIQATVVSIRGYAPAPPAPTPTDWSKLSWLGGVLTFLCIAGFAFYFLKDFKNPTVKLYEGKTEQWLKDDVSSRASGNSRSNGGRRSGNSNRSNQIPNSVDSIDPEKDEILRMSEPARVKEIQILQNRLLHVWNIPYEESRVLLGYSRGIPDAMFWRNMSRQYEFKKLWKWNNLPQTVYGVPEYIVDSTGSTPYTYVLKVNLYKGKPTRPIPILGWDDVIIPADSNTPADHVMACDRGKPEEMVALYRNKRNYLQLPDGRIVPQSKDWHPRPLTCYDLSLPGYYSGPEPVRFIIRRTRHNASVHDPEPPLTQR